MKKIFIGTVAALALNACMQETDQQSTETDMKGHESTMAMEMASPAGFDEERMDQALAAQSDEAKARFKYRHPKETLEFFGITPGMTVVEALPGGGWYTKVLLPYLGPEGKVIGVDYSLDMRAHFGRGQEYLDRLKTWKTDWVMQAGEWRNEEAAQLDAFVFGSMPEGMAGTVDAVLLFRATHHLNRFDHKGGHFGIALDDMMAVLKPGGVVGVVQHWAPENNDDQWANGDNGYLKKSLVIDRFTQAGFELVGESDINANPKDVPTEDDFVWRLPPSFGTSREDPALKEKMSEIGESNRMTLLFRKPA